MGFLKKRAELMWAETAAGKFKFDEQRDKKVAACFLMSNDLLRRYF